MRYSDPLIVHERNLLTNAVYLTQASQALCYLDNSSIAFQLIKIRNQEATMQSPVHTWPTHCRPPNSFLSDILFNPSYCDFFFSLPMEHCTCSFYSAISLSELVAYPTLLLQWPTSPDYVRRHPHLGNLATQRAGRFRYFISSWCS
jgi:hypothetical protein